MGKLFIASFAHCLIASLLWGCPFGLTVAAASQASDAPIRLILDQSPRAVEYQISRLTNDELGRVERRDDDAKYRPIYFALLTRKGMSRRLRDEGLAALVKLDGATPVQALLDALAKIPTDDDPTATALGGMLVAQPAATLRQEHERFTRLLDAGTVTPALRAAYASLMVADGSIEGAWSAAARHPGHLSELLLGVPLLPDDAQLDPVRRSLADSIAALLVGTEPADTRAAAVRAFQALPERFWPTGRIEPLARGIIASVRNLPPAERTEADAADAIRLGERLAAMLPAATAGAIRRELRALGVQIVRIETRPEQMAFTVRWFVVERGKPVQIVFFNPDAMPHNLVIGRPGSLETIGTAAMTMAMPADPAAKAYVPSSPLVLEATTLIKEGDTARLNFAAPAQPGEYVFACTFPGHWARMYGVMLVVDDIEAWEAAPTTPTDPLTRQPFTSR